MEDFNVVLRRRAASAKLLEFRLAKTRRAEIIIIKIKISPRLNEYMRLYVIHNYLKRLREGGTLQLRLIAKTVCLDSNFVHADLY